MSEQKKGNESGQVPAKANPPDRVRGRWSWVNPFVWTDRMLLALENGVKGGRWYSLMDKVGDPRTLRAAFQAVSRNGGAAGVDHQTVERFESRLEQEIERLARELKEGKYRPKPVKRTWIPKPGSTEKRPLGIPTVRDRVVQAALRMVLDPIYERDFAEHSYGFRPQRGCKDALRRVDRLLKTGHVYVVDADLKGYFDTIPHQALMERIGERVADGAVKELIQQYLEAEVMDGMERWTPERGSPQGAVISPLLSNIYLDPLDQMMARDGYEMVRYADDFVVLCQSAEEAARALEKVRRWTEEAGLTLHPTKTHVVDVREPGKGFDFLGYHFERGKRWPREKSLRKLKDAVREKTRKKNGQSLRVIISNLNRTLEGWFEYFKHSQRSFQSLDAWIRMRLRSILRKRHGRRGPGRGKDHQRWPNDFFAKQGLFSLQAAQHSLLRPR